MGGDQKRKRSLNADSDHRGGGLQSHWFCLVGTLNHYGTVLISLLLSVYAVTVSNFKKNLFLFDHVTCKYAHCIL